MICFSDNRINKQIWITGDSAGGFDGSGVWAG